MKYSRWGQVDHETKIGRGIYWVSTPGHGGLMIAAGVAGCMLSAAAMARGEAWGGYLSYEEDCLYAVACLELIENPAYAAALNELFNGGVDKLALLKTVSAWNADYLIERGITPAPDEYAYYLKRKADDKRLADHDPAYIVAARDNDDGTTHVWTADDKEYDVIAEGYRRTFEAERQELGDCKIVNKEGV